MGKIFYTTNAIPGRVFSREEMAEIIARKDNPTDFTPAMFALLAENDREGLVSVTTLTGTCPREHWLKSDGDYNVNLEGALRAIFGTIAHSAVEAGPSPSGQKVLREVRMAKRVRLINSGGRTIVLPFKFDELIKWEQEEFWHIRDYKTTRSVPIYDAPWQAHIWQLSFYRFCLSDFPGNNPPVVWTGAAGDWRGMADPDSQWWESVEPFRVESGEVVYFSNEASRRVKIGAGARVGFETLETVESYIQARYPTYVGETPVRYNDAINRNRWGFAWKCPYCSVSDQCRTHFVNRELGDSLTREEVLSLAARKGLSIIDEEI